MQGVPIFSFLFLTTFSIKKGPIVKRTFPCFFFFKKNCQQTPNSGPTGLIFEANSETPSSRSLWSWCCTSDSKCVRHVFNRWRWCCKLSKCGRQISDLWSWCSGRAAGRGGQIIVDLRDHACHSPCGHGAWRSRHPWKVDVVSRSCCWMTLDLRLTLRQYAIRSHGFQYP